MVNYQKVLEETLAGITAADRVPTLLLHSCCGPCSSYVLEYLSQHFNITVLYYNPNIWPPTEFQKRAETQKALISGMVFKNPVRLVVLDDGCEKFEEAVTGLEAEPEGGARCIPCFRLRLEETAKRARDESYDYFTTTLSVSPHKNAQAINDIGRMLEEKYSVGYLFADFKKRGGYQRSVALSKQLGLYRQEYCGCRYSTASQGSLGDPPATGTE